MARLDPSDGIMYTSAGEHYHVHGYVTVRVLVSFDTYDEPGSSGFDAALEEAVSCFDDWEVDDYDEVDIEIEEDEF